MEKQHVNIINHKKDDDMFLPQRIYLPNEEMKALFYRADRGQVSDITKVTRDWSVTLETKLLIIQIGSFFLKITR